MISLTKEQQRQAIRAQLVKELMGEEGPKAGKLPFAIRKQGPGKAKFLANMNKRPHKGDVPDYMPAIKKEEKKVRK